MWDMFKTFDPRYALTNFDEGFRIADIFFLVYDTTNRESLSRLQFYVNMIIASKYRYDGNGKEKPIAIIGTKMDVDCEDRVKTVEVEQYLGYYYFDIRFHRQISCIDIDEVSYELNRIINQFISSMDKINNQFISSMRISERS